MYYLLLSFSRLFHSLIPKLPSTASPQVLNKNTIRGFGDIHISHFAVIIIINYCRSVKKGLLTCSLQTVVGELYGPMMLVFTLIAILLFSMKTSGHTVVRLL